jgi:hypothetical protein
MAIAYIGHENKTANGNITVPAGCDAIYAVVKGSTIPPSIAGVPMGAIATIPASGVMPAGGIFQYVTPVIGALTFTFTGAYVEFIYLSGVVTYRPGALFGQSTTGSYTGNLVTTTSDFVIGAIFGLIGATALKGDTVAMTYVLNTTLDKIGYITPGDTLLTCLATDVGISGGFNWDAGVIHHDAVLLSAAHMTYPTVHHNGYWYTGTITHHVTFAIEGGYIYRYIDGGSRTLVSSDDSMVPYTYTTQGQIWHKSWDTHDPVWVEDSWQAAYDEDLADIWVPLNATASLTALFISIKTTPSVDEGDAPIFFG